jgi:hypothetical protein
MWFVASRPTIFAYDFVRAFAMHMHAQNWTGYIMYVAIVLFGYRVLIFYLA